MHNSEAINTDLLPEERWALSRWVKAIQQGNVLPCSEQANQMLVDLHEECTRQHLGALKRSLDWIPMYMGVVIL
eukprot:592738-Karenia_brevis.AAC.1